MKALIKTYYSEPRVDTARIMQVIFSNKARKAVSQRLLLLGIVLTTVLLSFISFLWDLNLSFFSTSLGIYSAFSMPVFIILNITVGLFVFISKHYIMLLILSFLLFLVEGKKIIVYKKKNELG